MLEGLLKQLVEQGREASLVLYLMATLVFMATGLHKEWIALGKTVRRDRDACVSKDKTFLEVAEKLVEQRILNERATVTMAMQQERIQDLELELARSESKWQPGTERSQR